MLKNFLLWPLGLNHLDNLAWKEVQRIWKEEKAPLNPKILAAIKGIIIFIAFLSFYTWRIELLYKRHYHE